MDRETLDEQPIQPGPAAADPPTVRRIEIEGRIVWQAIGAVLATIVGIWVLNQARGLVAMVAISFFFSLALEPGVRALVARRGWRRGTATGVVYAVGFLIFIVMVAVLIPAIAQLAQLIGQRGSEWVAELDGWLLDTFGVDIPDPGSLVEVTDGTSASLREFAEGPFGKVVGIATGGIGLVFNAATIAMFTFYFTALAPQLQNAVLRVFSPKAQERIGWTWDQAIVQTGGYFYSKLIMMTINFLGFFFTMVLVGIPVTASLALALFGSFVSVFIPVIGTYIGGAVPVLLALALQGWTAALIVLGYVLVYQQVENYWLTPKLSAKTMSLNGGIAFGAALAGAAIAGPMGAFTALPIAALITSFLSNYLHHHEVVYQPTEGDGKVDARTPLGEAANVGSATEGAGPT